MRKAVGTWLLLIMPCAAFFVGLKVVGGGPWAFGILSRGPGRGQSAHGRQADRAAALEFANEGLRKELLARDQRIAALEKEIKEVRDGLPSPLTPEEEKRWRENQESQARRNRRKAIEEKANALRNVILQRKDKVLRREALAELDRLLRSDDAEELVIGLATFRQLPDFILDKKAYRAQVYAVLEHENREVRLHALNSVLYVSSLEEKLGIVLSKTSDPAPEVRAHAVALLGSYVGYERDETVATVLRKLLHDEDASVRNETLTELSPTYDYRGEMEDLVIELSKDPETREQAHICLSEMKTIDAKVAQRLVELYDSARVWRHGSAWMESNFTDDARPIVYRFCLDIVSESFVRWERENALKCLQRVGDASVLRELEMLQRTPLAQGIEDELTKTVGSLRQQLQEEER